MFDFATLIDRHGTGARNGTMSPTGLAPPICCRSLFPIWISPPRPILDAVSQRLAHGCSASRWRNEAFLGAIAHWYASRFNSDIDPQSVVYGPSVIYMVAETIRQWSKEGDGVVVHTPAYDAFYNTITANRRRIARCH